MYGEQFIQSRQKNNEDTELQLLREVNKCKGWGLSYTFSRNVGPWPALQDLRKVLHACAVPYYFEANLRIPREK